MGPTDARDEIAASLLGAESGDQTGDEVVIAESERLASRTPGAPCPQVVRGYAIRHNVDPRTPITVPLQTLTLRLGYCDHAVDPRREETEEQSLVGSNQIIFRVLVC